MSGLFDDIAAAVEGMFDLEPAFKPYEDPRSKNHSLLSPAFNSNGMPVQAASSSGALKASGVAGNSVPKSVQTGVRTISSGTRPPNAATIPTPVLKAPTLHSIMPHAISPISASAIYSKILAMPIANDDDERLRNRSGGGGGQMALPSRILSGSKPLRTPSPGQGIAARAAIAAGAQPAVFKVISSASSSQSARALMQYLGTREGEGGKKHDIAVFTNDGRTLTDRLDRREEMTEWAKDFREPFQTSNFIETIITVDPASDRDQLHEALNAAFGSKPFIYARDGGAVKVFAYTDMKATKLAAELSKVNDEFGRGDALRKADAAIEDSMKAAGIDAKAAIMRAYSKGDYFLQKFMRANPKLIASNGDDLNASKRPDLKAAKLLSSWKSDFKLIEPRNVHHLLFSAREGTDPKALIEAAKAVLSEKIPDHKWVLAHHAETKHVHVHAMVLSRSELGGTLRLTKPELYDWRETFAEKARENGIDMVATSRMDLAASRPYNMRQAGAFERAQRDPRYSVSQATINRVENKRAAVIELKTVAANGGLITARWAASAVALESSFPKWEVDFSAPARANEFSSAVRQLMSQQRFSENSAQEKSTAPQSPAWSEQQISQSLLKQVDQFMNAPMSPLEFREKIADVSRNFAEASKLLSDSEGRKALDEVKTSVMELMNERLNEIRVDHASATNAARSAERSGPDEAQQTIQKQPAQRSVGEQKHVEAKDVRQSPRRTRDDDVER